MQNRKEKVGDNEIIKLCLIGEGHFSKVYLIYICKNNKMKALKEFKDLKDLAIELIKVKKVERYIYKKYPK